ncbi:hypothetical protein CLAIMM_11316 isoform 2 [Cladophialophora immunda]|nr:hypothetical protein CLAIMM_11316 isoform 2 [Cladophialophora immunda]
MSTSDVSDESRKNGNGHVVGNGTCDGKADGRYNVQEETLKVFETEILNNPRIRRFLPEECFNAAFPVTLKGSDVPSVPINWRQAESVSALKMLEAMLINVLVHRKYNLPIQAVTIDTDHATLFIMSCLVWTLDPQGENVSVNGNLSPGNAGIEKYFPPCDKHRLYASLHRAVASNWLRCSDGKFFQSHGDLNPDSTLKALGLPLDLDVSTYEEAVRNYQTAASRITSAELQRRVSDIYHQSGQVSLTSEEYWASEHGKANEHVDLFEIHDFLESGSKQPPCWWPNAPQTSPLRPLAGLKVVDLTRILAGPSIGRGLAELGASVMRVMGPHLPEYGILHPDTNWGKWNCYLDLRTESDRAQFRELILDADVVINGYRPGAFDKFGFGREDVLKLCAGRERGIIYVRENCYGWYGPWQDRSGWQQISDAVTGCAHSYGQALGLDEPVTPIFPNSDYCTGLAGICGTLIALLRRGKQGGSYGVDVALNYYNQWLVRSVGTWHLVRARRSGPWRP